MFPFPLYHGSSSHYIDQFRQGEAPADWPLKGHGVRLLRDVWARLSAYSKEPDFLVRNMLDQKAGPANWQHGELYATPSKGTAVTYAEGGAEYGGELMTQCRKGLDLLSRVDESSAQDVLERVDPTIHRLLSGGGKPILVELVDVGIERLETETERDREIDLLLSSSQWEREVLRQQTNFRLPSGSATVAQVRLVDVEGA